MKIYCLTENQDLEIGLKLAGCDGEAATTENISEKIDKIIKQENIGILLISKSLYNAQKEKIENIRRSKKLPLITILDSII